MKEADFGGENPPQDIKRTPAEVDEQIDGSAVNEEGSAESRASARSIKFSDSFQKALRSRKKAYDEEFGDRYGPVSINELKAVARRGMGAYSSSHHPSASRTSWSLGRVHSYLNLRANGEPENSNYTQDNDLLPEGHPATAGGEVDEVFDRYKEVTGFTVEQAEAWLENPNNQEASGKDAEKHIRRNIYIMETSKSDWDEEKVPEDLALSSAESRLIVHQAKRTVAFHDRQNNGSHSDFISRKCPHSKKEVALWNWTINDIEGRPTREEYGFLRGLGRLRPMMARQGGKFGSREKIVEELPEPEEGQTYIEPFLGGGSVFFYRRPVETEVISDTDRNLMAVYEATPNVDLADLDWKPDESEWETYQEKFLNSDTRAYDSDKNQVRNYIYWRSYSYGNKGEDFDGKKEYKGSHLANNSWSYRKRLYHARTLSQDYRKVLDKYDNSDAVVYMDPPYPGTDQKGYQDNAGLDVDGLVSACEDMKGRFLLTLPWDEDMREAFSQFNQKGYFVQYSINDEEKQKRKELMVSNYKL